MAAVLPVTHALVEDTSNLKFELFLNQYVLKVIRPVKWYIKSHVSFFTTFMYINLHDGIDFDGFNNITFGKKIFFDSHFHLFSLNIIGIFLLIGNAYKFFNAYIF